MLVTGEKQIYNAHLIVSRTIHNKPYTVRKNFETLEPDIAITLNRLATFFKNHEHIDMYDFFKAPYVVLNKDVYYDLHFYITRRAIKAYTTYRQHLDNLDPDSNDGLQYTKAGIQELYKFCSENKLTLDQYKQRMVNIVPQAILHLKEHKINYYILHGLEMERNITMNIESVLFMIPDFNEKFQTTKTKYMYSKIQKKFIKEAFVLLGKQLIF